MAGWHSLSGYLQYKSGNNAFGRLITRRRVWCVLEESKCQLLLYKCEEDAHKQGQTADHIDIRGAAISLDLEHQNQFVINCDKKEHLFTAANHESMMIWLLGLQAKRDLHSKKLIGTQSGKSRQSVNSLTEEEYELWSNRPSLYMTYDQHHGDVRLTKSNRSSSSHTDFQWEKYRHKTGGSVDSGMLSYKKRLEASKSFTLNSIAACELDKNKMESRSLHSIESDSDDVFGRDVEFHRQKGPYVSRNWRKIQRAVLAHVIQSRKLPSDVSSADRYSASSRSASSDSAIERGDGTPQELVSRLGELERELISTKCELAKVMNQQTCYQELLLLKEDTIKYLEEHGDEMCKPDGKKYKSPCKHSKLDKDFQERIRVLQNQNRFLNEEVKKLAKLRLQENGQYQEQNMRLQSLEANIDKWKMDYVSLIESSIRFPGDECIEDVELCLYGGDKHKRRVQSLLEEARKNNPRLPTYESLANNEVHVDIYGFKHVYTNTGLLLHYLCTELTHHYLVQAGVYEEHQKRWTTFMRQHGKDPTSCLRQLKVLCRGGIPDRFRKQMWRHLVHFNIRKILKDRGDYYYRNLCNMLPESPLAACYRKQVSLDLMRTMPGNVRFSTSGSKGIMDLQDVLLAFCMHNPTIGYCQGMNFIVGMSLIFLDPEDAFWTLVAIAESYFSPHYFDHSLIGAQSDQQILKDMVRDKLPALYHHLEGIDIELSTITLNWFLAVFFDAVPFQTLLRIWDCFLLEGPKVLFRFALAILKQHERDILQKTDTMGIMKHLKACARLTYDVDGLVKLAFEGLKPFPKRKDIISKQTCYLNGLKEKYKKKELQRLAFAEREQLYMNMESECGPFLGIECAVAVNDGKVLFCYGDQHVGRLSCVACGTCTMCNIEYKLDSRLMCMCFMGTNELLLGTISWMLVSIDVHKHEQIWQIQLHDAILSVCCYDDDAIMATRLFSGLADGTIAVTEKPFNKIEPNVDVMYIMIGQAPVTCLMLVGDQLWCASGNTVAVIHAKTLDAMDTFSVSVNPYDHILSLVASEYGIWISLRGSSILELWDPRTLNCRMLYDTRTDRYPQLRKEDDTYFNRARITSMLANENKVWVGTGEGNLIVYEILESAQLKTPTELSPSIETSSSMSYITRPEKRKDTGGCDVVLPVKKYLSIADMDYSLNSSLEAEYDSEDGRIMDSLRGDEDASRCRSRIPKQEKENTLLSHSNNDIRKERPFIRRRSSSTNDLELLQATHYQTDMELLNISNTPASAHSENALEQLVKARHISSGLIDHMQQDEMEQALESHERRKSVQLVFDAEIVERTHEELKRRVSRNAFASDSSESEDSIIDSKLLLHKSIRSRSSSRRSSISLKKRCKMLDSDMSKEDSFEAHLEEKAMQESLVNTEIEQKVFKICATNIEKHPLGSVEIVTTTHDDRNLNKTSGTVTVLLQTVVDKICEEELEKVARQSSLLGSESLAFDDNYLSSSPCMTATPVYSPLSPNHNNKISNSTYSMSVDNTEDDSCKCKVPNEKLNTMALAMSRERMDEIETIWGKKNLDECSGAVSLCIDSVGKMNEERLNKVEIRHIEHTYLSSSSGISATPVGSQPSSNTVSHLDKCTFDMSMDHTKGDKDEPNEDPIISLEMSLDSSDKNDMKIDDSTCTVTENVDSVEDISVGEVPLTRRRSSVMDDLSILCSDCNMIKQKCNECLKLMKSQESLRINERRLSLHSELVENSSTNEKISMTEKVGVLNSIRDINEETTCGGWISLNEGTNGVERKSNAIGDRRLGNNFGEWFSPNEDLSGMASHKVLCNTDHEHTHGDCNAGMKMNKKKEVGNQADKERLTDNNGVDENMNHENEQVKVFPSENSDRFHFTRQEKVGYWLHSLTKTNTGISSEGESHDTNTGKGQPQINDADLDEKNNRDKQKGLDTRNYSRSLCGSNSYQGSSKGSVAEEDVFFSADESVKPSSSTNNAERPDSLKLKQQLSKKPNMRGSNRSEKVNISGRSGSADSDGSSGTTQKSSTEVRMNMHDSGIQYRLDFSSIHVDTDVESEPCSPSSSADDSLHIRARYGSGDSRKCSLDLGSIQENCSWLESECAENRNQINESKSAGRKSERQKIFEFLKTPSLASRHASLGLKIIDDSLEWADLYSGHCTTPSITSATDQRLADFLRTPSINSKLSSVWSSYENISTQSHVADSKLLIPAPHVRRRLSHSPSTASIGSDNDLLYNVDLNLEAKMKISEKPVKCLLSTTYNQEAIILSFSGSFGDDEAVLKWRKHEHEQLWTNEPVLEICPKTNTAILPTYMRRRMSSNSSFHSHCSGNSNGSQVMSAALNKK